VLFALILFAGKAASAGFGSRALYWTSALGGSIDVDAAALSVSDLLSGAGLDLTVAAACVLLALLANALVKTAIAFYGGGSSFARSLTLALGVVFGAGTLAWILQP